MSHRRALSSVNTTRALICLVSLHNNYNNTRSAVLQYKEQEEYSIYRHNPLIAKQQTLSIVLYAKSVPVTMHPNLQFQVSINFILH